jgi:hypothetical protein
MQPLLKDAVDMIQPAANGHSADCSQHYEERVIVASNGAVTAAVSSFTSQEDSDNNGALVTLQESLPANAGDEAPKQNGFGKDRQKEPLYGSGSRQFFPPGRIIHMVAQPPPESDPGEGTSTNEIIGVYETPRDLYGKIRLAPSMIAEHYMPSYISTMESFLEQLERDENSVCTASNGL